MEKANPPLTCPHCAGPLSKEMETSSWTIAPFIRDSFSMIGTAVGGTASAFYGFNHAMPIVQRWLKGPMWVHFLVGAPPVMVFSSACAGLAGGAVSALAQLASSSYHAAVSPSPSSLPPALSQERKMPKSTTSSTLGHGCITWDDSVAEQLRTHPGNTWENHGLCLVLFCSSVSAC